MAMPEWPKLTTVVHQVYIQLNVVCVFFPPAVNELSEVMCCFKSSNNKVAKQLHILEKRPKL